MPSSSSYSNGSGSSAAHAHHHAPPAFSEKLQHLTGMLEVKFKGGAFSTWSDVFVRLEGRWMVMYKRERDSTRLAAIELGPGVDVTDISDLEISQKFPRRFDVHCKGGLLPSTEYIFRTKSRKDRDLWVHALASNIHILDGPGLDVLYAVQDLEPAIVRLKEALTLTPIRIRSQLAVRCASGEEIVAFLVAEDLAKDRSHANLIGRRLLSMNVIHHVVWEKDFLDSPDHYTISDLDDESNYVVEHFQKYMDSRRFWKYFDDESDIASGNGRRARSTASSESMTQRSSTATLTSADLKGLTPPAASQAAQAPPTALAAGAMPQPPLQHDKKAKKCTVCGKSFNPLRRRYFCSQCTAVVCSHCSMPRKTVVGVLPGAVAPPPSTDDTNSRVCVSCKLASASHGGQDDFYDRIFSAPVSSSAATASSSDLSVGSRASSFSHVSANGTIMEKPMDKRSGSASNLYQHQQQHHHQPQPQQHHQPQAYGHGPQLRRKSSTASTTRRESFSSSANGNGNVGVPHDCHLCMNEACAPLMDFYEVPYPVTQDHLAPTDRDIYLAALELEDEFERLRSVRVLMRALETSNMKQTVSNMCSMASIATSCPVVMVGLLDSDEYVLCGQFGMSAAALPGVVGRELALASHTCRNGSPIVCSDLSRDIRFSGNTWRRDVLRASFYAGIPLQLSNGHIVGAIEVFDVHVRFGCMDVLAQMQTIVKGVLRKFEDIVARAPPEVEIEDDYATLSDPTEHDFEVHEVQPSQIPPPMPAVAPGPTPVAPAVKEVPAEPATGAPAAAPADAGAGADVMSQNEMEMRLMQLLSQTTTTQEQLRNQQGQMFTAISSHSQQISALAKQLERMESTLTSKLEKYNDKDD